MTTDPTIVGLSLILILGIVSYWLAWHLRLPPLLVVFVVGLVAGPGTGLVNPDDLLGPALFPAISLALGLILFQGGLTLRLDELAAAGTLTLRLLLLVAPLTLGAVAALAYFLLELDLALSLLLGSLLLLPAPMVIGPLLARLPLGGPAGPGLKWEATVVSPLGAAVAVLIFEAVLAGDLSPAPEALLYGVLRGLLVGLGVGIGGGVALWWLLDGERVPASLRNSIVVLVLLLSLLVANWLQPEAGLLALPVAGFLFANQRRIALAPVVGFVDGLHVLLAGPLLFVLAARLDVTAFTAVSWPPLLLVTAVLLLLVRPLALFLGGWGSRLTGAEKLFIGWVAPRGVVPVALGTVFALELAAVGHPGAEQLALIPLLVTLLSAGVVWTAAAPLAGRLGLVTSQEATGAGATGSGVGEEAA